MEVLYLRLIISTEGIRIDPVKVAAVKNWETPKNIRDVRAFIGFANFYRRFIVSFSNIITALTYLIKKDAAFAFDYAY